MSLTLLLDLDDTLLVNNIDEFLPAYLKAFAQWVTPALDPGLFTNSLLAATRQMVQNHSPRLTLREAFENAFYPLVKVSPMEFQPLADQFYAQVFPTLQGLTKPRSEAVRLVERALERGYHLAIATNPLFPRTAIEHRLSWAGLSPDKYPFELITSYERFHFSKPEPAYYAELLAHLGWPSEPVIMVGDDLAADINPSRRLGLPAFWVPPVDSTSVTSALAPSATGTLDNLLDWLDQTNLADLTSKFNHPDAWRAILLSTPATLDSICRNLDLETWRRRPHSGEWCLTEIICHWRDVDREVNLPRVQKVLQVENPFLPGMDTDPWANERKYREQDGPQALQEYINARLELLDLLNNFTPQDWNRPARHAIFGRTQLSELIDIIGSHDRLHIQQVIHSLKEITGQG